MKLDNDELYSLLKEKDVKNFFHANTLTTSFSFLENKGLMSRGLVETKGLSQTPQSSDEIDKKFNVWNDVFLDVVDLHGHFPRQNLYGPILFKFNIEFLKEDSLEIWVTKNNPIYWDENETMENKYFQSVCELKEKWDEYDIQRKMFTVRNATDPILFDYLEKIIVDDPCVSIEDSAIVLSKVLKDELSKLINKGLISKDYFEWRKCSDCYCKENYLNLTISDLKRLFLRN